MTLFISLLLGAISLAMIVIKRAYESTPVKELKKRARAGDQVATMLHQAASYEYSLTVILWALVGVSNGVFFVYVSRATAGWFAAFIVAVVLWFGFLWLPQRRASSFGIKLAARISPVLAKLASILYPVVRKLSDTVGSFFPVHVHTGIYDKEDFLALLTKQRQQPDNQISDSSLEIAAHAITFGDKLVRDVLTPRRVVKSVNATDTTGPILMSELHESGHSRFPVYEGKQHNIVGILYLRDLVRSKSASKVSSKMRDEVLYIHEDQSLEEALKAILKTHQHLFIVVNSFEEYVGIITIEDVLEEIIGKQIIDEFDQYEDLRAVAARAAAKDHQKNTHPTEETRI